MIFYVSPSMLETAACLARFRYHYILGRRSSEIRSGADAGSCVHRGFAAFVRGQSITEQEQAIDAERAKLPVAEMDYRNAEYLRNALAQVRAELAPVLSTCTVLEVERRGEVLLGEVLRWKMSAGWEKRLTIDADTDCQIALCFVRDLVLRRPDGSVAIVDLKTSSRDDSADVAAFQNSGQFKAYKRAWNLEYPTQPCRYLQPLRLIMRPPTKTGVTYTVKLDTPVSFDEAILDEWHAGVMRRVTDILARDPDDPNDWPMTDSTAGLCRNQWGCCQFLPVCTKPPADRALKLATDAFKSSKREEEGQ